jgi:hypothetical protein
MYQGNGKKESVRSTARPKSNQTDCQCCSSEVKPIEEVPELLKKGDKKTKDIDPTSIPEKKP